MDGKNNEFKAAMAALDGLTKSQGQSDIDDIDKLSKSLEAELGDVLAKSEKQNGDEGKVEIGELSENDDDALGKSQVDDDFSDELVKASEAYASMEESVRKSHQAIEGGMDDLRKAVAALTNLTIKQAMVITDMVKSRQEDSDLMRKSMSAIAAIPTVPNKAVLGIGSADESEPLQKSVSEVRELLIKAVTEKRVAPQWLGLYDAHKNTDIFDAEVKTAIGI